MRMLTADEAIHIAGSGEDEVDGAIADAIGTYVHCVTSKEAKDGFANGAFIGAIAGAIDHYQENHA